MKKALISMSVASLFAAANSIPAQATENLIYVPVNPCRIADTREAGAILANDTRNFFVSGTTDIDGQGGNPTGCPAPRPGSEPLAISAYVTAVPLAASTAGSLAAYPSNEAPPATGTGATVNFAAGEIIGNTTNITLCEPDNCPNDGEFAVLARNTNQHVVVDVQGYFYPATGTCPDDMVAVGSLCVDTYEASLVDANGDPTTSANCNVDGSDCGADAGGVNPAIFAQSEFDVLPANGATWFQAAIACANVGKRLPTAAEWTMAAAGTVQGTGIAPDCNSLPGNTLANTGASANCVSAAGVFDMVGNLWEWTADLTPDQVSNGSTSAQVSIAAGFGESHSRSIDTTPGTDSMFIPTAGAIAANPVFGFRCVR